MRLINKSGDIKTLVNEDPIFPITVIRRVLALAIWICCLPSYLQTSCKTTEPVIESHRVN